MQWYKKLHWQIILGLTFGTLYGILATYQGWGSFTYRFVAPWGEIFINLLKLIAVPLVLTSLISGVASLNDMKRLSKIGGKTITIYIITTIISVSIGLITVNISNPGKTIPQELKNKLQNNYSSIIDQKKELAQKTKERRILQPLIDMVPNNFFKSASNNRQMLQIVFLAILFGIALIQIPHSEAANLIGLIDNLNTVILKVIDIIMLMAPLGVFSLISSMLVRTAGDNPTQMLSLLSSLGLYSITVIIGLIIHTLLIYPLLIKFFTRHQVKDFFKAIMPAQLLAFSTSSSGATLPVTMECCEKELRLSEEISSFVLPLGATINMDGTALYQAVATVFIAQATGIHLGLSAQLIIVFTAVLASIGTASVPGAGIIMLVIILESVGVPTEGIALILGVDRILDMMRTVTNVTGDATVAAIVDNNIRKCHT